MCTHHPLLQTTHGRLGREATLPLGTDAKDALCFLVATPDLLEVMSLIGAAPYP